MPQVRNIAEINKSRGRVLKIAMRTSDMFGLNAVFFTAAPEGSLVYAEDIGSFLE